MKIWTFLSHLPHLIAWTVVALLSVIFLVDLITFRMQVRRFIKEFHRKSSLLNRDLNDAYKRLGRLETRVEDIQKWVKNKLRS